MDENYAKERIEEDFKPEFPRKDIFCKDCAFKRPGVLGYRTAYCDKYEKGKPKGVLFNRNPCPKFEAE